VRGHKFEHYYKRAEQQARDEHPLWSGKHLWWWRLLWPAAKVRRAKQYEHGESGKQQRSDLKIDRTNVKLEDGAYTHLKIRWID
jgi:hypothetical protein